MEKFRRNLSQPGKVCSRDIEEIQCKVMATPMDSNLKLLDDESLELVDVTHYRQIIGSFMYLTNTRPDICFALNTLIQYLVQPRWVHLVAAKHVVRHLKGTMMVAMSIDCRATQMQIGLEVSQTKNHFRWMLQYQMCYEFIVQQEIVQCFSQHD